jgi:hypothetical protein
MTESQVIAIYMMLIKDKMMFVIYLNCMEPISTSGDSIIAGVTIAKVESFPVKVYQKPYLTKVRAEKDPR